MKPRLSKRYSWTSYTRITDKVPMPWEIKCNICTDAIENCTCYDNDKNIGFWLL